MLEVNIWICCDKRRRADIKFIRDPTKCITCSGSIATCISCAAVDWDVNAQPYLQTLGINPWVIQQDAFNADMKFSGYAAYGVTFLDHI